MKTTSQNYDIKMAAQCRNRSHIRISLNSAGTVYSFTDDQISVAEKTSDIDPLSRRLPKETFTFSIIDLAGEYNPSNPSGKWSSLDENAVISVEFGYEITAGTTEWLAADEYCLDARPTVSGGIAKFVASSRLCHLTKNYYKGTYGTQSFYSMAVAVLTDAGLSASDYIIDPSLSDIYTDAPLPITTHVNCLQLIAHATGCTLRTVNGVVRIDKFSANVQPDSFIVGTDSIALGGDTVSKIETLYKVQANQYVYTPDSETSVLATVNIDSENETPCHIEYATAADISLTVDGSATITDLHVYAQAADFVLNGTGTFTVTVMGKKITSSVSTMESVISLDTTGATDSEKNQLITSTALQYSLIYNVANYLQYRLTHTVKYRGNPELEPLDALFFATQYGTFISALVLTHKITFNGAVSGSMTLKSISEISDCFLYDSNEEIVTDRNGDRIGIIGLTDYQSNYTTQEMDAFISEVID